MTVIAVDRRLKGTKDTVLKKSHQGQAESEGETQASCLGASGDDYIT